jgi:hypothetical protein
MQTTRKAVRYYIDREADTPIIRSVPVSRPSAASAVTDTPRASEQDAAAFAAAESRRRDTRHRLTSMVQAGVRKYRHHAS